MSLFNQSAKSVFKSVSDNLHTEINPIYVTRKVEIAPKYFPYICMTQIMNDPEERNSVGNEPYAYAEGYQVELSSNKEGLSALDELETIERNIFQTMINLGYTLKGSKEVPNLSDPTISRKVMRFIGITNDTEYVYRR